MPSSDLLATIVTAAGDYSAWQSVEVERTVTKPVSYARFQAAEPGTRGGAPSWATLQLMPGDEVTVELAGQLALTGLVETRQAAYDAEQHLAEIIVQSYPLDLVAASVDGNSGQYLNQSFVQIANAIANPNGIEVTVDDVPGADKPFARVSEHIGEAKIDCLGRLAMMRDLHVVDDENGNLLYTRGTTQGGAIATLVEGGNILKARMVLRQWHAFSQVNIKSQQVGGSSTGVISAQQITQVSASAVNTAYSGRSRVLTLVSDMPGDQSDAQLRANHEVALNDLELCEALITVPGWLAPNGLLWFSTQNLRKPVNINSPSLVPQNPFQLILRGAKCRQDSVDGTVTDLDLCIPRGLSTDVGANIAPANASGIPGLAT